MTDSNSNPHVADCTLPPVVRPEEFVFVYWCEHCNKHFVRSLYEDDSCDCGRYWTEHLGTLNASIFLQTCLNHEGTLDQIRHGLCKTVRYRSNGPLHRNPE